jgi:hypothetical protein
MLSRIHKLDERVLLSVEDAAHLAREIANVTRGYTEKEES